VDIINSVQYVCNNYHKLNMCGGRGQIPPPKLFLPKNSILATEFKSSKYRKLSDSGGKRCTYIVVWFKPVVPLFLIDCIVKFLIHMVDFAPTPHPHPNVISQVTPMMPKIWKPFTFLLVIH
jgi:hypothetical protein